MISVALSSSTVEALKEKGVTSSVLPGSTSDSCINTAKGKKKNTVYFIDYRKITKYYLYIELIITYISLNLLNVNLYI